MTAKIGSNRTFMELKFIFYVYGFADKYCSNRTFMELKLIIQRYSYRSSEVLIAPLWN